MGHLLFLLIHLIVLASFPVGLLLTIPLHLIYSAVMSKGRERNAPNRRTHVRCPECMELVRRDASRCMHCGLALEPVPEPGFFEWWPRWQTGQQRSAR
jgi:hypothetical protein